MQHSSLFPQCLPHWTYKFGYVWVMKPPESISTDIRSPEFSLHAKYWYYQAFTLGAQHSSTQVLRLKILVTRPTRVEATSHHSDC